MHAVVVVPGDGVADGAGEVTGREPAKDPADIGQVAYEAYCDYVGWQSVHGEPLPGFSEQMLRIQNAWRVAAARVRELAP